MTVLKPPALIQYSVLSSNLGKGIVPVLFRYSPTTNSPAISSCFSTAKYVVDINSWPPHKHHRRFERSQRCATRSENPFKLLLPPAVKGRTRCTNKSSWLGHLGMYLSHPKLTYLGCSVSRTSNDPIFMCRRDCTLSGGF